MAITDRRSGTASGTTPSDRKDGVTTGLAAKRPCLVVAAANITLSGLQTIDGVALAADERVLAIGQTAGADNGIWVASTGVWTRPRDFDGSDDVVCGTLVFVTSGSTYTGSLWYVSTPDDIVLGTTSLTFSKAFAALDAIATLTGTGLIAKTGPGTAAVRTVTGTANEVTVANGDGVAGNPTLSLPAALTFSGKTITGGSYVSFSAIDAISVTTSDDGATAGPAFNIIRASTTPAANDLIGEVSFFGRDSGGNFAEYARLQSTILDPTDASEDGQVSIQTMVAGTLANRIIVGQGLQIGSPTGGDKGAGTLNAAGTIYVNNVATALAANDLAALEALSSTGIAVRTASDTWAQRTLQAPAAGFTITNPAGVAGDPTFVLANDLAAIEALSSTGFAVRTASDTWAQRTLAAATGLAWTNPAGTAGNPSINFDIPSLTVDATPDSAADYLLTYDASASAYKKSLISSVVGAAAAGVTSINGQTGALDIPSICGLRLSLVTGTPVHGDVSSAGTVYATPAYWAGNFVPLWNGTDLVPTFFGQVSQLLSDATKSPAAAIPNANYDIVGWLDGSTPRATRSDYWKKSSTVTITNASPGVATYSAHGAANGTPCVLTTTGALPTGLTAGTTYFMVNVATNTFQLSATVGGAAINTSSAGSGTHTATIGDDSGAVALGSGGNCEADLTTSGLYLNKNLITNGPAALRGTILGSVRTDSAGTITYKLGGAAAGGDPATLTVYNIYNAVDVAAEVSDSNASWNYTSSTVVPLDNGGTGSGLNNRISILTRLQRDAIDVSLVQGLSTAGAVGATIHAGFALNSTSAFGATTSKRGHATTGGTAAIALTVTVRKIFTPQLGWNYFQALQQGDNTNACSLIGGATEQSLTMRTRM